MTDGYAHAEYAASLSFLGTPRRLPRSGVWLITRPIGDREGRDAMGCYPLLVCGDWEALATDLEELDGLVSLTAVIDPFGPWSGYLARCFPDRLVPFKRHFVTDLTLPLEQTVCAHHQRNVRWAQTRVEVERCDVPVRYGDDWVRLYHHLLRRHDIGGIAAFPAAALVRQLAVPGLLAFRASADGETIGMVCWMVTDAIAYYHLGASSDAGYRRRASFALMWASAEHFRSVGLRWLSLGAAAGYTEQSDSGLYRFKQGWATGTRPAYLGGRIFDPAANQRLSAGRDPAAPFFPAYRHHA